MKTLLLLAAGALAATADDTLNVVATLPSLGSVAREVGGDRVKVSVLAKPAQDPHFVDPKPSFMVTLRNADLFVVDGLELEVGWVPPLLEGCRNDRIQTGSPGYFDASVAVSVIDLPKGAVDRSQGDVHPLGNPHYSLDPLALRGIAAALAERLTAIDPKGADTYAKNAKAYQKKIDEALFGVDLVDEAGGGKLARLAAAGELDKFLADNKLEDKLGGWMKAMEPVKGKPIVAFHTNMNYFWNRFGLVLAGTVEAKAGIPPPKSHVADIVLSMRQKKIGAVVTQPYYNDSEVNFIGEKTGAKVLKLDVEGDDALATIDAIVKAVSEALKS